MASLYGDADFPQSMHVFAEDIRIGPVFAIPLSSQRFAL
jgi:hypothetical protein